MGLENSQILETILRIYKSSIKANDKTLKGFDMVLQEDDFDHSVLVEK